MRLLFANFLEVCRPALTPHRRTHVTSCSMCLDVLRCRDEESIHDICLCHRVSAAVRGLCDHVLKHILLHGANTLFSRLCVFVVSANRVVCRSCSATLHQFLRKYMALGVVGDFAFVFACFRLGWIFSTKAPTSERHWLAAVAGLSRVRRCCKKASFTFQFVGTCAHLVAVLNPQGSHARQSLLLFVRLHDRKTP